MEARSGHNSGQLIGENIGSTRADIPKIITAKDVDNLKRTLEGTIPPILAITGQVVRDKTKTNEFNIPFIDLPSEGGQLIEFIKKYVKEKPKQQE